MKYIIAPVVIIIVFGLGFFAARFTTDMNPEIVKLEAPLKIKSETGEEGILPEDTILFYVKGMSEGFDVYKVYVNIEGKPLKLKKSPKKWLIAPVWAVNE